MEPEDERLVFNLVIPPDKLHGAQVGEMVRALVTHYPTAHLNPKGMVAEVLRPLEDAAGQTLIVIGKYGLPDAFPPEVLAEANKVPAQVPDGAL